MVVSSRESINPYQPLVVLCKRYKSASSPEGTGGRVYIKIINQLITSVPEQKPVGSINNQEIIGNLVIGFSLSRAVLIALLLKTDEV